MVKSSIFITALGLAAQVAALPSHFTRNAATTVKFMPLGASIVEQTCWRAFLQKKMKDAGITNVDFVGSMSGPASCTLDGTAVQFDKNHEGHSGARVTDYAAKGNLTGWLSSAKPDMILMHVGTNDVIARIATADIIKAYGTLLGQMRASNPDMVLVLSKLIPIDPKVAGQAVSDDVGKLNTAMEEFVRSNTQQQSPIVLVDMTGFDTKTMTKEGEHPNEAGDKFMADRYFSTVKDALVVSSVQKMLTA